MDNAANAEDKASLQLGLAISSLSSSLRFIFILLAKRGKEACRQPEEEAIQIAGVRGNERAWENGDSGNRAREESIRGPEDRIVRFVFPVLYFRFRLSPVFLSAWMQRKSLHDGFVPVYKVPRIHSLWPGDSPLEEPERVETGRNRQQEKKGRRWEGKLFFHSLLESFQFSHRKSEISWLGMKSSSGEEISREGDLLRL